MKECSSQLKQHYLQYYELDKIFPQSLHNQIFCRYYKKDEYLCLENEPISELYFVVKGKTKVIHSMENGKQSMVTFDTPLSILGEIEFMLDVESQNALQAVEDTIVLGISYQYKQQLIQYHPFLYFVSQYVCHKIIRNDQNNSINQIYTVSQRLCSYIVSKTENHLFHDNYTHLAEYLGCSHRQLLRVLKSLCDQNILRKTDKGYEIIDETTLEQLAAENYQLHLKK